MSTSRFAFAAAVPVGSAGLCAHPASCAVCLSLVRNAQYRRTHAPVPRNTCGGAFGR